MKTLALEYGGIIKSEICDALLYVVFSSFLLLLPLQPQHPPHTIFPNTQPSFLPYEGPSFIPIKKSGKLVVILFTNYNSYIIKTVNGRVKHSKLHCSLKFTSLTSS
jgi:hypothetical protein